MTINFFCYTVYSRDGSLNLMNSTLRDNELQQLTRSHTQT